MVPRSSAQRRVRGCGRALRLVAQIPRKRGRAASTGQSREARCRESPRACHEPVGAAHRRGRRGAASTVVALEPGDVAAYLAFQRGVNIAPPESCGIGTLSSTGNRRPTSSTSCAATALSRYLPTPPGDRRSRASRWSDSHGAHDWAAVENTQLPMPNARGRHLAELALGKDQWRALWVPPTLPPYELQGPFAGVETGKRQRRSSSQDGGWCPPRSPGWLATRRNGARPGEDQRPRSSQDAEQPAAALPGAEAERSHGRGAGTASRGLRSRLPIRGSRRSRRPLQPATVNGRMPKLSEVLAQVRDALRPFLRQPAERVEGSRPDPRWYWAAPMLLDQLAGLDVAALIETHLSCCLGVGRSRRIWVLCPRRKPDSHRRRACGPTALGARPQTPSRSSRRGGRRTRRQRPPRSIARFLRSRPIGAVRRQGGRRRSGMGFSHHVQSSGSHARGPRHRKRRPRRSRTGETFSTTAVRAHFRVFSTSTCGCCASSLRNVGTAPQTSAKDWQVRSNDRRTSGVEGRGRHARRRPRQQTHRSTLCPKDALLTIRRRLRYRND